MAKLTKLIKLQLPAGKATPAPPVGTALGPAGINIADFVNKYNEATRDRMGEILPVEISVFDDRSYTFVLKTPPVSSLILKALGKDKGSGKAPASKIGVLTKDQVKQIAETKMPDLNANDIAAAMKIVEGSARSMGVDVK